MKTNLMNATIAALFLICLFSAGRASAQLAPVMPNTPQPIQMTEHPQHATEHAMLRESTLLSLTPYGYAKGEVPLVELGAIPYQIPLGDVARAYREEHANMPKAVMIFESN